MHVVSVNVGRPQLLDTGSSTRRTGIYKEPVHGAVEITAEGIVGDAVCDTRHHGGVDQAVYVYGALDYEWWGRTLGEELQPGTFGENLTIAEFESSRTSVGDRFHIGKVVLEVTAPRIPCGTLARRMNDREFVARFREAERPGVYCRVIEPGYVRAGDGVVFKPYPGETVTIVEVFRVFYESAPDLKTLQRHLAAPIAIRDRVQKQRQLEKL